MRSLVDTSPIARLAVLSVEQSLGRQSDAELQNFAIH
ncbi:hypothetical protein GZL_09008 [Streptomyces sp. 769]|nr:hypothetical protein GZL_09008 [Streptomyces sp. 769]